ncbi:hypothetical protein AVEN_131003-1 [Araneus ventricosus]|uniref:Uncharacterized protein n=1 Tax=Araneus ventricosus TaxID=182803 RepID=A0A4Y2QB24_ARAVE|nr:hypothetical protein AVEN_105209-1 [Araneus ventricosus]GBN61390.1 hypothetical protein AVEN_131003-1 [Araneus ventricosus]
MSNTEADDSLARNEILTDNEIIRTVIAEEDDDDVTPVISHSEAVVALNTSLQWAEEQNFEAHENMLLRRLRNRTFELKIGTTAQKKSLTFLDTDYVHSLTYVGESASPDAEDVLNEGNTISHSAALQSVETFLDYMGQRGFNYGDIAAVRKRCVDIRQEMNKQQKQ